MFAKMDTTCYTNYFNAFVKAFSDILSSHFGLVINVFPSDDGTVLRIYVKRDAAHKLEKRNKSSSFMEALMNATGLTQDECGFLKEKILNRTAILVITPAYYIICKPETSSSWTEESALEDIDTLFSQISEKAKENPQSNTKQNEE